MQPVLPEGYNTTRISRMPTSKDNMDLCPHHSHSTNRMYKIPTSLEFQPEIYFTSVLLAFPQLRRQLPRSLKARVLLWHSTIIHLIWATRNEAIAYINSEQVKMDVEFNGWQDKIYESI
jgi:hypothetical protein